ncbi:MAG: hypothetical protein MUC63_10820 [Planctomycetes bacterium]|nr:hypothetical protein [Planctomycetota bacterium]
MRVRTRSSKSRVGVCSSASNSTRAEFASFAIRQAWEGQSTEAIASSDQIFTSIARVFRGVSRSISDWSA